MAREIFQVTAQVVDANGTWSMLSGYPKNFDSRSYNNDIDKARKRAEGDWHGVMQGFSTADTRQLQLAQVVQLSTGAIIQNEYIGGFPSETEE